MSLDGLETKADILRLVEQELYGKAGALTVAGVSGLADQLSSITDDIGDLTASGISGGIVDAKGDLIGATANDAPARVPVGANGTFLKADSAQALGLIWAALAVSDIAGLQATLDGKQPLDADLTNLAALNTQAFGRSLLEGANAGAVRTLLGLGGLAVLNSVTASEIDANAVGASEIGSLPAARVYNSANISVNHATQTALTFNSERFDTDTIHSTASNTSRLTATTAGVYSISGTVEWAFNSTGRRHLYIVLNGATHIANTSQPPNAVEGPRMNIATHYKLAATDYVELHVYHEAGVAVNISAAGNASPEFSMAWMGDG